MLHPVSLQQYESLLNLIDENTKAPNLRKICRIAHRQTRPDLANSILWTQLQFHNTSDL
jgi:hypothetical protein